MTVLGAPIYGSAHARTTAPDRGVRRRRVLDRVGQHPARRLRAVADRRRATAGLLPADRQRRRRPLRRPLLPGVLRRAAASRRTSRCSAARPASAIRGRTCSSRTSIYVGGGSVVSLLGTWRAHGIDEALREAWESGVVLCGGSAGSLCWFTHAVSGFHEGPARQIDGLGFLPWSNAVHYEEEAGRRTRVRSRRSPTGSGPATAPATAPRCTSSAPSSREVVSSRPAGAGAFRMLRWRWRHDRTGAGGPVSRAHPPTCDHAPTRRSLRDA